MILRSLRSSAALAASAALLAGALAAVASPATAVPESGPGALCPDAYPAADLTAGQRLEGLTTTERNPEQPGSFGGEYVATIPDGIKNGTDLLLVRLDGYGLDPGEKNFAGVWAGMSGSPVYAADGRLVGAVSYSFANGSNLAGVTPAQSMYDLVGRAPSATPTEAPEAVRVPAAQRRALAAEGVTSVKGDAQMHRLDAVRTMSGAGTKLSRARAKALGVDLTGVRSAPSSSATREAYALAPGSNLAVSASYGGVELSAVGTTTAICDGRVIGFGHALDGVGTDAAGLLHGARTLTVQESNDPFGGSYKIAALGAPVGRLDEDRSTGIVGTIGAAAATTEVVTNVKVGERTTTQSSQVSAPGALAMAAGDQVAAHVLGALDTTGRSRLDVAWKITYVDARGTTRTFSRGGRFSSISLAAEDPAGEVAGDVNTLVENEAEAVTVTRVQVDVKAEPRYLAYKVGSVDQRLVAKGRTTWKRIPAGGTLSVKRGAKLTYRVNLVAANPRSAAKATSRTVTTSVPRNAKGTGRLMLTGTDVTGGYDEDDEEFWAMLGEEDPNLDRTLAQLLAERTDRPRNDTVQVVTSLGGKARTTRFATIWADAPVTGRRTYTLRVR